MQPQAGEPMMRPFNGLRQSEMSTMDEIELMAMSDSGGPKVPQKTMPTAAVPSMTSAEVTLELPRSGAPNQELYDFLTLWRTRCINRLNQVDKSSSEWQRMNRFFDCAAAKRISQRSYGRHGGFRFTMPCEMPCKPYDREIMRLVEQHWATKPDEIFRLPAAFEKRVRYEEIQLALSGLTGIIHEAFWPDGRPSFDDIPMRKAMYRQVLKQGKAQQRLGLNACTEAGAQHGSRLAHEMELLVNWMVNDAHVSAFSFVMQRLSQGLDFCTLRLLVFLDKTGRVPLKSEFKLGDPLTAIGTPVDLICWQCAGFDPTRRVGCHFMEIKSGYECGPFEMNVPGDKFMQYLTGLYDTPYMRAVIQMTFMCAIAAHRYEGYVAEEQTIIHVAPRLGAVREYGMPGWVEDEKNCAFIYECVMAYVSVAHRKRVCSGLKVPRQFIGQNSAPPAEMAAVAAGAAGFISVSDADDWSFLSERHLQGMATAATTDDDQGERPSAPLNDYNAGDTYIEDMDEDGDDDSDYGGNSSSSSASSDYDEGDDSDGEVFLRSPASLSTSATGRVNTFLDAEQTQWRPVATY